MRILTSACFIFFVSTICNAQNKGYTINESLKSTIDKKNLTAPMSAVMNIEWLENGKDMSPLPEAPAYSVYVVLKDTIRIVLMPVFTPGIAVMIDFLGDSVSRVYFVQSPRDQDNKSLKKSPSDKEYTASIVVPAKTYKLTLSQKPTIKQAITGYLEFESENYYQKSNGPDDKKSYKARAWFVAEKQ
jgi:hypothetical protein